MTKIELRHEISRDINEMISQQDLDFGIVVNPRPLPELVIKPITNDRFGLWSIPNCNSDTLIFNPNLSQSHWLLRQLEKKPRAFNNYIESDNL